MIDPYKKGKRVSVIVWAAFWARERSTLWLMSRDKRSPRQGYTAGSYLECLEENIPDIWEPGLPFMQDNALIHTAHAVRKWLEDTGIDVLEWLPYRPDLNPIEHLWYRLKKKVYEVRPDIEQVGGDADRVRDALWDALERA